MLGLRGDHQHRKIAVDLNLFEAFHHLKTIHVGHFQVQQDQVISVLGMQGADVGGKGGRHQRGVTGSGQHALQQQNVAGHVVHNQDLAVQNVLRNIHASTFAARRKLNSK